MYTLLDPSLHLSILDVLNLLFLELIMCSINMRPATDKLKDRNQNMLFSLLSGHSVD